MSPPKRRRQVKVDGYYPVPYYAEQAPHRSPEAWRAHVADALANDREAEMLAQRVIDQESRKGVPLEGAEIWLALNGLVVVVFAIRAALALAGKIELMELPSMAEERARQRQVIAGRSLRPHAPAEGCEAIAFAPAFAEGMSFRNGLGMGMVRVEPGTFRMGSETGDSNEKPVREVTLPEGFWLAESEVTQAQWKAVMGNNPSWFPSGDAWLIDNESMRDQADDLPVEQVSWQAAVDFCRKLTEREHEGGRLPAGYAYALPTEAQWEYACRAGKSEDRTQSLGDTAWYKGNSADVNKRYRTHYVMSLRPNPWGFYDMLGNVSEWCADPFQPYGNAPGSPSSQPDSDGQRVVRGGGWNNDATICRSSARVGLGATKSNKVLGFRVALVVSRQQIK